MSVVQSERSIARSAALYQVMKLSEKINEFILNNFNLNRALKKHKENINWVNHTQLLLYSEPVNAIKASLAQASTSAIVYTSQALHLHPQNELELWQQRLLLKQAEGSVDSLIKLLISLKQLMPQIKDATLDIYNNSINECKKTIQYSMKNNITKYSRSKLRKVTFDMIKQHFYEATRALNKINLSSDHR